MKNFPRTLIIGILILAAFAISVSAQENVCCCAADGTAEPDTPKLLSECPVTHQQFYIPTPEEVVEDALAGHTSSHSNLIAASPFTGMTLKLPGGGLNSGEPH